MLNVIQINALKLRIVRNFVIIINYYEKERKLFTMKKENNKKSASALIGAAFLMATSAIGPGFLTQTGKFTYSLHGSFGFVILISVILAAIVQLNVWRVLYDQDHNKDDKDHDPTKDLCKVIHSI